MSSPNIPTLPSLPASVDPEVRRSFEILRAWFASAKSFGGFDTATVQSSGASGSGSGGDPSIVNPPTPPRIANFTATGAFATIIITWTDVAYSKYGFVQIWRSTTSQLADAQFVGSASSPIFVDTPPTASLGVTYYYWGRVISYTGVYGPWSSTNGSAASTADTPEYVLELLLDSKWKPSHAYTAGDRAYPTKPNNFSYIVTIGGTSSTTEPTWSTTINATFADGGVTWKCESDMTLGSPFTLGIVNGVVKTVIKDALIADAAITNAKIHDLAADKITAGSISADRIAAGTISALMIASHAITADQIASETITASEIAANAITATKIDADTITTDHLVADAVTIKSFTPGDFDCEGGESYVDVVTTQLTEMKPGSTVVVVADLPDPATASSFDLIRTAAGVDNVIRNITSPFNLTVADNIESGMIGPIINYRAVSTVPSYNYNIYGGSGSDASQGRGQSFPVNTSYTLCAVAFNIKKIGTPTDTLNISIEDALTGGSVVASGTFSMASLPTRKTTTLLTLQSPGILASGQTYYCKLTRSGARDTSNYASIYGYNSNLGSGSLLLEDSTWSTVAGNVDVKFKTYALVTPGMEWIYTLRAYANTDTNVFASTESLAGQITILQMLR